MAERLISFAARDLSPFTEWSRAAMLIIIGIIKSQLLIFLSPKLIQEIQWQPRQDR